MNYYNKTYEVIEPEISELKKLINSIDLEKDCLDTVCEIQRIGYSIQTFLSNFNKIEKKIFITFDEYFEQATNILKKHGLKPDKYFIWEYLEYSCIMTITDNGKILLDASWADRFKEFVKKIKSNKDIDVKKDDFGNIYHEIFKDDLPF